MTTKNLMMTAPAAGGGGTPVLDTSTEWWTPADISGGSMIGQQSTVDMTLNGSASASTSGGYNIVQVGGADADFLDAGDNFDVASSTDFTWLVALDLASASGLQIFLAKREGSGDGYNGFVDSGNFNAGFDSSAGGNPTVSAGAAATGLRWVAGGRDGSNGFIIRSGGSRTTTFFGTTAMSNAVTFRLGRGSGATAVRADMDVYGAAVWIGTAVSDADLSDAYDELLAAGAI